MKKSNGLVVGALVVSVVILITGAVALKRSMDYHTELIAENTRLAKELKQVKKDYQEKNLTVNNAFNVQGRISKNIKIRSAAANNYYQSEISQYARGFFSTYYTWDNTKDYLRRKEQLSPLITDDLANNKEIFDDGKDDTGHDFIKASGIKAEFLKCQTEVEADVSGRLIKSTVKVDYTTSDNSSSKHTATRYYEMTYDTQKTKITDLKLVFTPNQD